MKHKNLILGLIIGLSLGVFASVMAQQGSTIYLGPGESVMVACATCEPVPPTDTPVLPTSTPVPPTATPLPPTNTPEPTATPMPPTDTPIPPTATSTSVPVMDELAEKPLLFPCQNQAVVDYFNSIARNDDIAAFPNGNVRITTHGLKVASFASWAEAEATVPALNVDGVLYNPEHWGNTPLSEQNDLVGTIQQAEAFCDQHDLLLIVYPDLRFAMDYTAEIAPHVDIIGFQGQRLQDDISRFVDMIQPLVNTAQAANPYIQVNVQVGAASNVPVAARQMIACLQAVSGFDGISIWSTPNTLDELRELVNLLRS